jgi:molybdopterin converting factor small subunit
MVEIRYGDQIEVADLAGQTVSEARQQFRSEFGIPDKARAKLNGRKVSGSTELDTELNDDDKLSFAVDKSKAPFLVGALLLAMAVTGGMFAFGFINASTSLNGTVSNSNFADVTVNSTGIGSLAWNAYGFYKGSVPANGSNNGTSIFNIDTATSGYTGDLVVTVSLGNTDALAKVYRVLSLKLGMCYPNGTVMDINEDNTANASNDWVLLTLNNGSVSLFPKGTANMTTVRVLGGSYITNIKPLAGWGSGTAAPQLFCEVAQR